MTETLTGTNRSGGISFAKLLELDSHPVSSVMSTEMPPPPGNTRVPAHVYHSKAWHDLEVEKLWKRVWQLACLEEEIPNVGDYHVYEIADMSFLIVRTGEGPDSIKAYRNACLHRGRLLREQHGQQGRGQGKQRRAREQSPTGAGELYRCQDSREPFRRTRQAYCRCVEPLSAVGGASGHPSAAW